MSKKTRLFSFYILIDLFKKVSGIAKARSCSISSVINEIIAGYYKGF